ncbi:hypothetical protein AQUCO_01300412v1 [Aquilegia coerulea]|uniref:F-box domain-containing protein n=1 Tax=Aquilegia coerulea TaxID=218851 RepID=A0A2G5E1J1_AQUCA|nr:hypothetical protein AQUCO_01300412v1 [Aquilegia coerulea]
MENCGDFIQLLDPDVSTNILSCLDDPADIVRVSCVSRSWHHFVIENGFSKRLCLKLFPEVSSATNAIEVDDMIEPVKVGSSDSKVLENSEKNHRIYTILARGFSPTLRTDCISEAIYATSTDNDPEENISNTLEPRDKIDERSSYWSSEGESDDRVPERLTYRLSSKLCLITEINIQPFQAYFQYGFPIYSAKAVRFWMGHRKSPLETRTNTDEDHVDGYYVWTYVSPEFPMIQENCLQKFKLPNPVLCVGGFLQIELLGRVQRQEMDGLFYICVSHVQVVGRPLLPTFDAEVLNHSGKCVVKYCPEGESTSSTKSCEGDSGESSRLNTLTARWMRRAGGWEQVILNTLLGNAVVDTNIDTDTDIDSDEEMVG